MSAIVPYIEQGHKIMRLDGKITQTSERERRVQEFQQDQTYSVFLLTTQVRSAKHFTPRNKPRYDS